jgi:5-methylcytosine-specific restriction endonuclease McrA
MLAIPFSQRGRDVKRRCIIEEQQNKCANCGLDEWLKKPITLELDHKNGDKQDERRENLWAICPNCHSQTSTWRGRKKSIPFPEKKIVLAFNRTGTINGALKELGIRLGEQNRKKARAQLQKEIPNAFV